MSAITKWLRQLEVGSQVAVVTQQGTRRSRIVRETKRYWITAANAQFRKDDGRAPGDYRYGHTPHLADPDNEHVRRELWLTKLSTMRRAMEASVAALGRAPEDHGAAQQLSLQAQEYVKGLEAVSYYSPLSDTDAGETK